MTKKADENGRHRSDSRRNLVDDEVDFAQVLGDILESAGHDVRVAFDAGAALGLSKLVV